MSTWWNQPRSQLKSWDSMSFGSGGTGREKATSAKTELEVQPLSRGASHNADHEKTLRGVR